MEKEQLQKLAKDFCEAEDIVSGTGVSQREGRFYRFEDWLTKFAESLIESGKFVEMSTFMELVERNSELVGEIAVLKESTVSSAGKEVKTAKEYIRDVYGDRTMLRTVATLDVPSMHTLMEDYADYCNQFKATPVKEISDQEIEAKAKEISEPFGSREKACIKIIKWYREQLKAKP